MNNSGDSLQMDENLARMIAACDQAMEGSDPKAPTIGVPRSPLPNERLVGPLSGTQANEASLSEVLPDGSRSAAGNTPLPPLSAPAPGGTQPRIGRFELRRQLGKGGCGIVFLAYDPKLEREVALKIPRPEMLLSQDARKRLVREALAAAEFDHPNLVPVYETGEIGPVCFIATAFCPGQTLGEWLDRQSFPIPVRQTARVIATVAEAVQHAHDRGVLHRDLKPNNVILQATKEDPEQTEPPPGSCVLRGDCFIPRVVDFGLAKLIERGGPSETTTRQILGTPKYMAPEQAQARHDDVGPAADVYALGVILYEMLAGRAPFDGATDVEVLRQAIDGYLVQPRHIRPEIPRDLEAICLKAMDRVPGKRYRTAIDLADDLRRFLDDKPTIARPLKWSGRAARWLRRNDQAVAVVVLAVVASLLLVIGSWSMYQSKQFKSDYDSVVAKQAAQTVADQQRVYAETLRAAFLAWRAGDTKAAADSLEACRRLAQTGGDTPDFAFEFLNQLVATERLTIPCPAGPVTSLAVSPDGSRLATGHADGTVSVWEAAGGRAVASARAHDRAVEYIRFEDSRRLATADTRGSAKNWTLVAQGLVADSASLQIDPVLRASLAVRHGGVFYTAGEDGVLRGRAVADAPLLAQTHSLPRAVEDLALAPDGRAAVATREPAVRRFDSRGETSPTPAAAGRFDAIRFSPQGALSGVERRGLNASVVDLDRAVTTRPDAGRDDRGFAMSPDRSYFAAEGPGGVVVRSLVDGRTSGVMDMGLSEGPRPLAVSDGGRLISIASDGVVRLWTVDPMHPGPTLAASDSALMRFVPVGHQLVTAGPAGVVRVWNTSNGAEEWTFYAHVGRVCAIAGSPDGRTLVTGSALGEVKFWDLRTGRELMAFHRHAGAVTRIEFAGDGSRMLTAAEHASGTGELAFWR